MSTTTILSLPLELIHHIALQADQPTQASLSATSKSLHHAADRALYRHISLSSSHPSTLSAVLTLSKRANNLGPHVRSFSLAVASSTPVLRAYASAVARALEGMHALKDLNLSLDSSSSWLLDLVEPRTAYPSLKSFTSSFALDGPVSRFLSRTPALTSLSLAPSPSATLLPPTSIPVLTHFSGSLSSAPRGRPLSTLYALDGDLSSSALSALPPLSVLSASTSTDLVPFLHALAAHHPTLAYLRLAAPLPLARDATFPDIRFYEDVACALDKLPALVDFELAGMHWPSHVEPTPTPSPTTPTTKRVWHSAPSSPRPSSPSLLSPMEEEFFPDSAFPESLSLAPLEVSEGEGEGDLYEDLDVLF